MVSFSNNVIPKLLLGHNKFQPDTFTGLATTTYPAGTILARNTAASNTLVPYVSGGATGIGTPVAVLTVELTTVGATTYGVRVCIAGDLLLNGTAGVTVYGGGTPAAPDEVEQDLLRSAGLVLFTSTELNRYGNTT